MDVATLTEELLGILERENISVRRAPLGGTGGGLCQIRGERIFFIDTQEDHAETAAKCAIAVAKSTDTEKIYLKPEVREFVEKAAAEEQ